MCAGGHPHGDSLLPLQSASCPGLLPSGTHCWFGPVQSSLRLSSVPMLMLQEQLHRYPTTNYGLKDIHLVFPQVSRESLSLNHFYKYEHLSFPSPEASGATELAG